MILTDASRQRLLQFPSAYPGIALSLVFLLGAIAGNVYAAEAEEPIILGISGHLISSKPHVESRDSAVARIEGYYALLPEPLHAEGHRFLAALNRLMIEYEIAFAAADTAELNNVVSDIARNWAAIRTLHAQQFQPAVCETLRFAFGELYPLMLPAD